MTTNVEEPISVAILAGGQSRRMGQDKALFRLQPDGKTLLALVIDVVSQLSTDLFLVAPERPGYDQFGIPIRPDLFSAVGALGGIASAIVHAKHDHCLVVSCDMPFLNLELLRYMANQPCSYDVLIPKLMIESRQGGPFTLQTLHAIYGKTCVPAIEKALSAGDIRTTSFLQDVIVQFVDEPITRQLDPYLRSFFSINTPEALATARSWTHD